MQKDELINYLIEKGYNATESNNAIKIKLPRFVVALVEDGDSKIITINFGLINRKYVIPLYTITIIFVVMLNVRSYSIDFLLFTVFVIVAGFVNIKKRFADSNKFIKDVKYFT